jgi:ADP-ribose diphosphatase
MTKVLYDGRWFSVHEVAEGEMYVALVNAAMCVPLTPDGNVLFIVEPIAYGDAALTLYLPAGKMEPGEHPAETALRELQEEAGYHARRIEHLATLSPWVKYFTAQITVYLARDLTPNKLEGDEHHAITIESIPLTAFEAEIASGRLRDSTVIAALYLARAKLASERQGR